MSPCIRWHGRIDKRSGYGLVWCKALRRDLLAHRVCWEAIFVPIPPGLCVLHSCDNPPCVNPEHLTIGTHAENMRQMRERGRSRNSRKTVADCGHPFTGIGSRGDRYCVPCRKAYLRAWEAKHRAQPQV